MKLPLKLEDVKEHVSKRFSQQLLIHYSDTKVCSVCVCGRARAYVHVYVCQVYMCDVCTSSMSCFAKCIIPLRNIIYCM